MRILVVNAGSSSLKLRVLDAAEQVLGSVDLPVSLGKADKEKVTSAVNGFGPVDAAGHRIVHGGVQFSGPVRIEPRVRAALEGLIDLAPLHQPKSLSALDIVSSVLPDVPSVACFDTAFHVTLPASAATYALPPEWRARWNLRRYGFHGLSHAYASRRASELLQRGLNEIRLVICHLGAGASLAAVKNGHSVDTTMGFTPLEGLVMATRSGSVDPGLVLWLQEHVGTPAAELAASLEYRSGLLGLAGTADMRAIVTRSSSGDPASSLALDVYLHRLRAAIASMAAAMGGLDGLVFTGGVGENAPAIRSRAADGLGFLGVALDPSRNENGDRDRLISADGAPVQALVIAAREDLEIARQVRTLLQP